MRLRQKPKPGPLEGVYEGPVVFRDGVHYPEAHDGDPRYRLIHLVDQDDDDDTGRYEFWDGQGGSHFERYHRQNLPVEPGPFA